MSFISEFLSPLKWSIAIGVLTELDKYRLQSRPHNHKVSIVRSALLPFLRSSSMHPSNIKIRAEDLDRRVTILNKWWTGLLEMLNGKSGALYSGNDRPVVLEAAMAIMTRPEWKMVPCSMSSRSDRLPRPSLKSRSTTSLGSTASDFLVDSVLHNVKNLYTQNLLAQMAFVVDKMGTRSVPASLVTFCGKAAAYAFFYCDGIAEILVRLWKIPRGPLQRILAEYGMQRAGPSRDVIERVNANFPVHLHNLSFHSFPSTMRHLRNRPQLPIATGYIPWHGPWIGRWSGKDTDLFFCFVKSYFDLFCHHTPAGSSLEDQICAPGYLLVLAQLLVRLDATVQTADSLSRGTPNEITGSLMDRPVEEANESATVIPLAINNTYQPIAENRLIRLIRDSLLGSSSLPLEGQICLAESFEKLMKAASQVIAPSDHVSCFALCDFLEEALVILHRFDSNIGNKLEIITWPFWLSVCQAMTRSYNTMAQVRLCAFLYGTWNMLIKDETRRRAVCLEWLLREDVFEGLFNHWCPMVRAYFMRLLVWRLGRLQSATSTLNLYDSLVTLNIFIHADNSSERSLMLYYTDSGAFGTSTFTGSRYPK